MASNDHHTRKTSGVQLADPPAVEAEPESLEKVRDILFGGQMRAVENRLQGLEERFHREQETIQAEFGRRLGELAAALRSEAQALGGRLAKLEADTSLAEAELRDQLLLQAKAAAAELGQMGDRLTAELQRSHHELRSSKTDRSVLAGLLSDLAGRLGEAPSTDGPQG
jgi:hypothetical protein